MRNTANNSTSGGGQRGEVTESWTFESAPELFQDDRLKPAKMLRLLPATLRLPETAPDTSRTLRKSCDSCVRLKRACNGESPCRLCARMGKCCSRSAKKRSGPPKGTKYQPRRQQSQEALATHQHNTTTSGSAGCSGSEADPSAVGGPYRVPKLRAGDDAAGAAAFVRRVGGVSKMGHQQQQQQRSLDPPRSLNPASSGGLCAEKPDDDIRGERGARAVATEVDDGALLLLRMLKTFHPSSRNLGFTTNVEADSLKATPPQAQRLPSLFDLGAVSSPAYPPTIMERQVVGCRPRRQTTPAMHPRLQQQLVYAQPREEQALPSLSASVTLSHAVDSRTHHLRETPTWGSFVETPYPLKKRVFDPYARDWVPPPMSSTFGSGSRTHGGRGTGGLVTGVGMERRQDYQLCAKYRRVDAGGFAALPGMVSDEATPGMGARFSKCSGPARYPNSNFRRFLGGTGDYYSG